MIFLVPVGKVEEYIISELLLPLGEIFQEEVKEEEGKNLGDCGCRPLPTFFELRLRFGRSSQ